MAPPARPARCTTVLTTGSHHSRKSSVFLHRSKLTLSLNSMKGMVLHSEKLQALYSRCGGLVSLSGSGRGNKALEQALDRRKVVELSFVSISLYFFRKWTGEKVRRLIPPP